IWPLFHYFPDSISVKPDDFAGYEEVNRRFCEKILSVAERDDWVWIHDYHLMLLPAMLREERPDLRIAYFHHIPFPSSEVFRIIPAREKLLQGLLGADLVGFHTLSYVRHFLTSAVKILG